MGQKLQGKLPAEGKIVLETVKEQWILFATGVLSSFSTSGIIEHDNKRLRIDIEVQKIISPAQHRSRTFVIGLSSNFDKEKASGITRAAEFFANLTDKDTWLIFGYIKGENKIPIVIVHYEIFDVSIYAQKLAEQEIEVFLPPTIAPFSNN